MRVTDPRESWARWGGCCSEKGEGRDVGELRKGEQKRDQLKVERKKTKWLPKEKVETMKMTDKKKNK